MEDYNVALWFAKNKNNEIITINEVNIENNETYFCPICGSEVISKALNSNKVQPHFAHVNASDCSTESMFHWWYKNKFLLEGDRFAIQVKDEKIEYTCKTIDIEKQYKIGESIYKPDITITTDKDELIYVEYNYKNKKKTNDYIDMWLELGNTVVEIDIKTLLQSNTSIKIFNPLFYDFVIYEEKRNPKSIYTSVIHKYIDQEINSTTNYYINRVKKLNWFWRDLLMYQKNELCIEDIANDIDNMDIMDVVNIPKILRKLKCISVLEEYINHKLHVYEKRLLELKDEHELIKESEYYLKVSRNSDNIDSYHTRFNNSIFVNIYGKYPNFYNEDVFAKDKYALDEVFLYPIEKKKKEEILALKLKKEREVRELKERIENNKKVFLDNIFKRICNEVKVYFKVNYFINIDIGLEYQKYNKLNFLKFSYLGNVVTENITLNNYKGVGRIEFICNSIIEKINDKITSITLNGYISSRIKKYNSRYTYCTTSNFLFDVDSENENISIKLKYIHVSDNNYKVHNLKYDIAINQYNKTVYIESLKRQGEYRSEFELMDFLNTFLLKIEEAYKDIDGGECIIIKQNGGEYHVFK